ncbi:hypothetical protein QOZ80_5BG0439080 [Eleusine coracana subsp. coracana]|nr:hypothetical protein QOZ80_5BG0439080 [Eleusine coracana subsp. coracana]
MPRRRGFPGARESSSYGGKLMVPSHVTHSGLEDMTNAFGKGSLIGRGRLGEVYKGRRGTSSRPVIVAKMISTANFQLDDKKLENEFNNRLKKLKHANLVQFISYCYGIGYSGKTERALCSEYLHHTSLDKSLSDEFHGHGWHIRYKIVKGTCEGLNYLHNGLKEPIYHLDLRPENILVDENMVPKLADFGWLDIFGEELHKMTNNSLRTLGHYPPEYVKEQIISEKFDVFSLGVVIIKIVTGPTGYTKIGDIASQEIINLATENWRKRLQETCSDSLLEAYCEQVKRCIEIAQYCVENDRHKRPNIVDIISKLNETENSIELANADPEGKVAQRFTELPLGDDSTFGMDDGEAELDVLERIIDNVTENPNKLKLPLLQLITGNFSEELRIGDGGCGVVYKGILPKGVIAVKRLFNNHTIDDKMFHQEVKSMMMVKHINTVRLLGYCSHTEEEAVKMAGETVMAQIRERLLCFEYISNGSLKNQIADELRGLEWHTRYQIIKGICEGLNHLHKEKQIIHMDLKPDNILLDEHMVPKITDFGVSRFDDKSQTMSADRLLSMGYCAPEYLHHGRRSAKSDIYSLGVIILELVTGSKGNPSMTKVLRRWKHRWNKSAMDTTSGYKQVAASLDLAQKCIQMDPADRPNIWDLLSELNKLDTANNVRISGVPEYSELEDMIGIEPLEMRLPIELNKEISCSIELTNDTDDYFAFRISTTSLRPYCVLQDKDIVPPRSKYTVTIVLKALDNVPPHNYRKDEFSVQSIRVNKSFTALDIAGVMFNEDHGKVVDKVNVMIFLDAP